MDRVLRQQVHRPTEDLGQLDLEVEQREPEPRIRRQGEQQTNVAVGPAEGWITASCREFVSLY